MFIIYYVCMSSNDVHAVTMETCSPCVCETLHLSSALGPFSVEERYSWSLGPMELETCFVF